MARRWYIARTKPRAEFLAAEELSRDGFETFFPQVKRPQNRNSHADTPLFPGYLFLRCELDGDRRSSFRQGHHLLGWVGFGGEVPSVPDEVVAALTNRVEALNDQGGLWRRFKPGDKVFVTSSKIQSLAEVVEEAKSPETRVRVLLQFMDRLVSAQVPWQDLQPMEGQREGQPDAKARAPRRTRGRGRPIREVEPTAAVAF